ncbi:MAG: DUF2244 domain-containing protein [Alphaproteobacteria bacterium]|nr:DUF2244 domain-containing protein [Alphaproteobacteria bacterium]
MTSSQDTAPPVLFSATLYPHRSLGGRGFVWLMAGAAGVTLLSGLFFWSLGAWPITGFFGLDLLLLYIAFRWSYRDGRRREIVELSPGVLTLTRISPGGRAEVSTFEPAWAQVLLEGGGGRTPRLVIAERAHREVVGGFLSPPERADFAKALAAVLWSYRSGGPAEVLGAAQRR